MNSKIRLIIYIVYTFFFSFSLFGQGTKPKAQTLNFDKTEYYNAPVDYSYDTVFTINNNNTRRTIFKQDIKLIKSIFSNRANFQSADFNDKVDFSDAKFYNIADFIDVTFKKEVGFDGAEFKMNSLFSNIRFLKQASFGGTKFHGISYFEGNDFKNVISFSNVDFKKEVEFNFSIFHTIANFSNVKFEGEADFFKIAGTDSTFFDFSQSKLPDLINFSGNTNIKTVVDFTTADFSDQNRYINSDGRWHYINLYNSDISKIKIDYQHFKLCFYSNIYYEKDNNPVINVEPSKSVDSIIYHKKTYSLSGTLLYNEFLKRKEFKNYLNRIFPSAKLTDTVVKDFLIHFARLYRFPNSLSKDEVISTYEKVLKNFDLNGQKVSYETLDIEYRDFKNGWFILPHIWNCYGYHKDWIFRWIAVFIVFFTIVTFFFINKLNRKDDGVYYIKNIPSANQAKTVLTFLKRLWYSLMYTSIIFFFLSLKTENINFKKAGVLYIFLVYSVGLLCLGYMANFVLQK
ncbi:MAG: Uncharacterized protein JWR09_500 [Mucilaginibacter sp.]|nr:Uncharacterized protein [Mucilaginibacter sp.]